jgi:peptidylprolyl isomerase
MRTSFTGSLVLVSLLSLGSAGALAQNLASPPPDLAAPPADAVKSPSGLVSKVLDPGRSDVTPAESDLITVHYTGWAAVDGRMLDSSVARGNPASFPLDKTMAGWRECVGLMTLGEKRRCWMPQELAYRGQSGRPTGTVVFDIELLDTRTSPKVAPADVAAPPADVLRTESGLAYKVLKPGTGARNPTPFGEVTVHYTGWTTDGKMFDSSLARGTPTTFRLDDVIKGWGEGVALMVEGERTRFWIPEELAYKGEANSPKGMLVFDIDLIRIN